ncbi:MAG: hypothetical protein IJM85_04775 [Clostridia bacterium]|nr:hypothetical protein [Clostridia bacterium]
MELKTLYERINATLAKLDLGRIWPGFTPLRFALFDDENCFFAGRSIEKTDAFCANTSINYGGEQIATWKVSEETDTAVLTSKLVHEMFHGFQQLRGWDCWPNELEALWRYEYRAENLGLKLRENELLLGLLGGHDEALFRELMSLRKLRLSKYPYESDYELNTEEIEGTANFVEWQVLRQLDAKKAEALEADMRAMLTDPSRLFPIRIPCYYTGALMINALIGAGAYDFGAAVRPAALPLIEAAAPFEGSFPGMEALTDRAAEAQKAFSAGSEAIVRSALERNEVVLEGPLGLVFVNIYNARHFGEYLTSTFFLMYRDEGGQRMLPGNFVIKMRDESTIEKVYRRETDEGA